MKRFASTVILILILPNLLFANIKGSLNIQNVREITVPKGYILSMDLWKSKDCVNIWFDQIEEFKRNNPHIKNPNHILVNQKIKIQDCRIPEEPQEEISENMSRIPNSNWFGGIYTGGSHLSEISDDTSKNGYNLGIKAGYDFDLETARVNLAIGYLINWEKTVDENNSLGAYEITTRMLTLESSYQKLISDKWSVGPMVNAVFGEDVGMKDHRNDQNLGIYGGVESIYSFNSKYQIELNLQQRLEYLNRFHLLGNIGIRIKL